MTLGQQSTACRTAKETIPAKLPSALGIMKSERATVFVLITTGGDRCVEVDLGVLRSSGGHLVATTSAIK